METHRRLRILVGALLWLALPLSAALLWHFGPLQGVRPALGRHWRRAVEAPRTMTVRFDHAVRLRAGDGVYRESGADLVAVGEITGVAADERGAQVMIALHQDAAPFDGGVQAALCSSPARLAEVIQALLGPAQRAAIEDHMAAFWREHGANVQADLTPWFLDAWREYFTMIEPALRQGIARREADFTRIAQRHFNEELAPRLAPLFQEEVWPELQEQGMPLVQAIVHELWNEFGALEFGARRVFLQPFVKYNTDADYFSWYWKQKAKPILNAHEHEIRQFLTKGLQNAATNPKLRDILIGQTEALMNDTELQGLLKELFLEVVVDNEATARFLGDLARDPALHAIIERHARSFEPYLHRINNQVLLNEPQDAINPRLAQVLRAQLLHKREHWLVLFGGDQHPEDEESARGLDGIPQSPVGAVARGRVSE